MKQNKQARYREGLALVKQRVLQDPATTSPKERQQAFNGNASSAPLDAYLKKVQEAAYRVTDDEVRALLTESTDDALFELTIAASLGAAVKRVEAGIAAIKNLED